MTEIKLLGSAVVCTDCEEPASKCDKTGCAGYACGECLSGTLSEGGTTCEGCDKKEQAYWGRYFGGSIKAHRDSCEALGLPSSASDLELMAAARRMK